MVKVTNHAAGSGTCCLTGREEADGLTVTFEDGTVKESFLSWKAFRQLLGLKSGRKAEKPQVALPAGSGPGTVK